MRYQELLYDRIGRRYILVGLTCTVAGYLTLYLARAIFHQSDFTTNALAFCAGLSLSFALNGAFVFEVKSWAVALPRFLAAFVFSYAINLAVLFSLRGLLGPSSLWPQFSAFTVYSVIFYLINRFWSFRKT